VEEIMNQQFVKLEELGDLLFERASKHVYDDLIGVGIADLREEFAVRGLARSSSFVRAVTESVFERLGSLKSAFLKSYVEPAQDTELGITPPLEEWLRSKWNEVWERELARARGLASSLAQTTGYSASDVHSIISTVEIRGRQLTFDMLQDIKIAVVQQRNRTRTPAANADAIANKVGFAFMNNGSLKAVIERDYAELQALNVERATKCVLVLSGSIIEGLVLDAVVTLGKWNLEEAAKRTLNELTNAALSAQILKHDRLSHSAKQYRNLVHPGREIRDNVKFSAADATLAKAAVDIAIREVADWHARFHASPNSQTASIEA
jgi:hypothetical protein